MDAINFKEQFKKFYSPSSKAPEMVTIPRMQYLMIDGKGDPNSSPLFQDAVNALYSVVYTLKFARKKAGKLPDYSVAPLEGLWWMGNNTSFDQDDPTKWLWTLMLWLPDSITQQDIDETVEVLRTKKPNALYDALYLDKLDEGKVAQILYYGSYSEEGPTIMRLHDFVEEQGNHLRGKHHEIYLGDPRRTKPENLKTIIRHPVT